jgi:hypothetical protein
MKNVMSVRRLLVKSFVGAIAITVFIASAVSPAVAQNRAEITGFFGYSFSEGIDVTPGTAASEIIDHVNVGSSIAYGGAVDFWVNDMTQVGFMFGLQDSSLGVKGSVEREVTGLNVYSYHGTATFHAGRSSSDVRPFFMFGLGATQYKPADVMGFSFDGETQFSGTLGVGVKAYVNEKVGLSFSGRWTPTYVKSDPGGVYCSPYWSPWYPGGCAVVPDPDYSNQFVLSGGIILRL